MDWLSQAENFVESDLEHFQFQEGSNFEVQVVRIHINEKDKKAECCDEKITSEDEYRSWINRSNHGGRPTILLAMHKRLPKESASTVPYGKETLKHACTSLFQHRSLSSTMPRTAHAVFNRHAVTWRGQEPLGPSIVYNCRSDTVCQTLEENDILMSVTSFPKLPLTFGIMYGCDDDTMEYVLRYLKKFCRPSFHPLMLPMMFVENERSRLLAALRRETSNLNQRLLEMQTRLNGAKQQNEQSKKTNAFLKTAKAIGNRMNTIDEKTGAMEENPDAEEMIKADETMLDKDAKAAKLWMDVSELKNGVQNLITILNSMTAHSQEFLPRPGADADHAAGDRVEYTRNTEKFQTRLEEMTVELSGDVRKCDGVLGGMSLATQMEWNYHTRRDAKANIIIAYASKRDSSQMRYISFLGMVFLPGTFLATLFSMTFFNWHPDNGQSSQVVSPWIGLYCGSAAMLTLFTYLRWRTYIAAQNKAAFESINDAINSDDDSLKFSA